jgi:hypothetical protein
MNVISLMILLLVQSVSSGAIPNAPESPGVYVSHGNAAWMKLQPAHALESKTKGLDVYIETGGYTNLNMSVTYRGAKAALRIAATKPIFFVRGIESAKDFSVIRLASKKDQRAFQSAPSSAAVNNKLGFKKLDIVKMAVVENPDHSFSVTPEESMKPGEYLILFDKITSGYDFGVD